MKRAAIIILFLPAATRLLAGTATYTVSIIDTHGKALGNTPVTIIESTSKERICQNTNASGIVTFKLDHGKEWWVNILKVKDSRMLKVPEDGNAKGNCLITYDYPHYERTHRAPVNRSLLNISTEDQSALRGLRYSATDAVVRLHILKENNAGLSSFPVSLTNYKLSKTFKSKTDNQGFACFKVPVGNEYEVDIDGIESFNYVDVTKTGEYNLEFVYQPVNIKETEKNDTITQSGVAIEKGASGRVAVKLNVKNYNGSLGSEDVYLEMLKSNKVYKAKTNTKGEAYFLLPSKRKYMVHFRYQKDVDVLNYTDVQGISNAEVSFNYNPDARLQYPERFVPTPDNLLLKEFVEFVTKQFPEPKDDDAIGLHVSWANDSVNAQSKEAVLQIGFKVKKATGEAYGPPLNLSLVIDKSGSMEGHDRIDALKKSLLTYIKKLRPSDIVSLVVFDDVSTVVVPAQAVGDGSYLRDMIEDVEAGGGTNIYNGMVDGYEQILHNYIPKGTNRLVLLTDGYGITPPEEMVRKSKEYNAKGIELSAVGVGDGYNQAMLALLATTGGGLLHLAGNASDIDRVFEKEMQSVLSPVAKSATIEILYNNKIVYKQLYGFDSKKIGNDKVEMKLDNLYSGLNTLALVKFDLNTPDESIEKQPIIINMSYYDYRKKKEVRKQEKAYLKWHPSTGKIELVLEAQQKKLYAIAILNQSLKVMAETFAAKKYDASLAAINSTTDQIKHLYPKSNDDDVRKLVNEITLYSSAISKVVYNTKHP